MFLPLRDDNPTRRTAYVTWALIALNVVSFLRVLLLPNLEQQVLYFERGFIPARLSQLDEGEPVPVSLELQALDRRSGRVVDLQKEILLPPDARQIALSFLTCMFLHGGWMHLIGNMWFLWIFGNNVEDRLGHVPFLLFYLGGGLLASLCHWAIHPASQLPVVGASGAVAAILGAYAITWPWARVHTLVFIIIFFTIVDVPALLVLGFWFVAQLLDAVGALGLNVDGGVAWWAHIGGFAAGALLMPVLRRWIAPPESGEPVDIVEVFREHHPGYGRWPR